MMTLRPLALALYATLAAAPLALLLALAAPLASAQAQPVSAASADAAQQHVLEIRDGQMLLDGRPLPPQNLPEGLDLSSLPDYTVNFAGPVVPVMEIDGVVYVLEGEHFKRLSETERADDRIFFIPEAPQAEPAPTRVQTNEEAYLQQLSERDQALYARIQREMDLERETLQLASRIRSTSSPTQRERLVRSLREKLGEAFELKQEIRAEEIEQAEAQIDELRRLLDERAARKDGIIERRMEELVGGQ